ncbi:hypothetical protein [Nonomuraea glycinis]|uniref:hypothetical protein n=1 Tax=Nonomuraea glycinis TaxID=2047744 RepID=UPI003F4C7886
MGRQALALRPFSMPPAKPQPTCTRPPSQPSATTPTTTSSPASPAWAGSRLPGCSLRSPTTAPASPTPRALKAYAGAAPITRASGRSRAVVHCRVKNRRLAAVGYIWAFASLTASPGARTHYDRRKEHGDRHPAALRNLYNRFLGCLFHCLTTRQLYSEHLAFPATVPGGSTAPRPPRTAAAIDARSR